MLALENVILPTEVDKNGIKVVATIDEHLAPLVEALALKYPEWRFESHYCRKYYGSKTSNADFEMVVDRVKVIDKYEELGLLGLDYVSSGKRFWVSNHRTEKMRERGSGMKTIHLNKAIKYVDKYFGRKNLSERVEEALKDSNNVIYQARHTKGYELNAVWNRISDDAMHFVASRVEEFKQVLDSNKHGAIDELPEKLSEYQAMQLMTSLHDKNETTLVIIEGSNYIVKQRGSNEVTIMSSEELPAYVRRGVGMLKLIEVGYSLSNVGVRVKEDTYVVVEPNIVREGEV